jgi:hypothetical protein
LQRGSFSGADRDFGSVYVPGMITIRSLLPDAFTAAWIESNEHRRASRRFRFSSSRACLRLTEIGGWLGRSR